MNNEFIFQAGDKVKVPWSDDVFTVRKYNSFRILVGDTVLYSTGKLHNCHEKPLATLVERPKRKVKKTFWFVSWKSTIGDEHRHASSLFEDKNHLIPIHINDRDRQVHSIEIEVEIEE